MDFVAIDFETANEKRSSPCAIGIAWVDDGRVIKSERHLIRPPELRFKDINKAIHGITERDVEGEPEFVELWPNLIDSIGTTPVVAHNAAFDIGVIRASLDHYDVEYPDLDFFCTWKISKKAWPGFANYRLDTVSSALGIRLEHHKVESDAVACAEIAIFIEKQLGCHSLRDAADRLGVHPGHIGHGNVTQCFVSGQKSTDGKGAKVEPLPGGPLAGECFVFTGRLESMKRAEAQDLVAKNGGAVAKNVSRRVSYLVIADTSYSNFAKDGWRSRKMKDAEDLVATGHAIEIISEADFVDLVSE